MSKKIDKTDQSYSIIENEFLTIVLVLKHFRKIILGCQMTIYKDNKNIFNNISIQSIRITRWFLKLEEPNLKYNILVRKKTISDYLSKLNIMKEKQTNENKCSDTMKIIFKNMIEFPSNNKEEVLKIFHDIHVVLGHPNIGSMASCLKLQETTFAGSNLRKQ